MLCYYTGAFSCDVVGPSSDSGLKIVGTGFKLFIKRYRFPSLPVFMYFCSKCFFTNNRRIVGLPIYSVDKHCPSPSQIWFFILIRKWRHGYVFGSTFVIWTTRKNTTLHRHLFWLTWCKFKLIIITTTWNLKTKRQQDLILQSNVIFGVKTLQCIC